MNGTPLPLRAAADADAVDVRALREVSRRVLWLSAAIVDVANHARPNRDGLKVGGHQASSASMVEVLHAVNYLLGDLDAAHLPTLRAKGGLQAYPSRTKDPDPVDFSTGSVGIGATAPLWAALHRPTATCGPTSRRPRPRAASSACSGTSSSTRAPSGNLSPTPRSPSSASCCGGSTIVDAALTLLGR